MKLINERTFVEDTEFIELIIELIGMIPQETKSNKWEDYLRLISCIIQELAYRMDKKDFYRFLKKLENEI